MATLKVGTKEVTKSNVLTPASIASLRRQSRLGRSELSDREATVASSTYKRLPLRYENTYRLEPSMTFNIAKVNEVTLAVLEDRLQHEQYEAYKCKELSQDLAAIIMERVKALRMKRYKVVAVVSIGSFKGNPGVNFGSRCLWNHTTDAFTSVKYTNGSLYAVAMVYGLYYE